MTVIALLDVASYVDGRDFTGDSNSVRLTLGRVELNRSTFRSGGWTELHGGLRSAEFAQQGHWAAPLDSAAVADLGAGMRVHTMAPSEVEGGVAYLWRAQRFTYQALEGDIGALAGFSVSSQGTSREGVVRGRLAVAPWDPATMQPVTYATAGPIGTAVQLPVVDAGQHLYASVHILGMPGTAVALELESDVDDTFAAPTTRAAVAPLTAAGGTWVTPVGGPIADTWWRVVITAITGTFTLAVALGIGQ